jgi:deoxycytidylate deaminase
MSRAETKQPAGPELVIGVVAAVGTDLDLLCDSIRDSLSVVNYTSQVIRLIELVHELPQWKNISEFPVDDRYESHMTAGNELRQVTKRGDALALLAIGAIREMRERITGVDENRPIPRQAYILRSLKHPKEVTTLRNIYGRAFVLFAAYSPRDTRLLNLARKIAESHHNIRTSEYRGRAESLIERDKSEAGVEYGQNVSETFPMGDVFLNAQQPDELRSSVTRAVELFFGRSIYTPTRDEYGMFHARGAALRSASLARQVGAVITTKHGDIVAVGTNEVPKSGGGLYWSGDSPDHRDIAHGYDPSDTMRRILLADVLNRLAKARWLTEEKSAKDIDDLVDEALSKGASPLMKDAHIRNLIEFVRAVHAEMAALMDASCRGVAVRGCTLYTTTFPCHDCAKHIVAGGIQRVVYIEPYPKSLTPELYLDSVAVDEVKEAGSQVGFEPFVGISPRRYMELFEAGERKGQDGRLMSWEASSAMPKLAEYPYANLARLVIEQEEFKQFKEQLAASCRSSGRNGREDLG